MATTAIFICSLSVPYLTLSQQRGAKPPTYRMLNTILTLTPAAYRPSHWHGAFLDSWQDGGNTLVFSSHASCPSRRNSSKVRYTHSEDRHHIAYSAYLFSNFMQPILSAAVPRPGRPTCNIEQKTEKFTNSYGFVYWKRFYNPLKWTTFSVGLSWVELWTFRVHKRPGIS